MSPSAADTMTHRREATGRGPAPRDAATSIVWGSLLARSERRALNRLGYGSPLKSRTPRCARRPRTTAFEGEIPGRYLFCAPAWGPTARGRVRVRKVFEALSAHGAPRRVLDVGSAWRGAVRLVLDGELWSAEGEIR